MSEEDFEFLTDNYQEELTWGWGRIRKFVWERDGGDYTICGKIRSAK